MKILSKNEKETKKTAADLAKQLHGGEVILMYGDLGAGKTVFVKGLAKALGIKEIVKSPTFNIMKCYIFKKLKIPPLTPPLITRGEKGMLCHIDAYRLNNFDDLLDIGAEEYLGKENVVSVVEWAERIIEEKKQKSKKAKIPPLTPPLITRGEKGRIIKIKIEHGKEENERVIEIEKIKN